MGFIKVELLLTSDFVEGVSKLVIVISLAGLGFFLFLCTYGCVLDSTNIGSLEIIDILGYLALIFIICFVCVSLYGILQGKKMIDEEEKTESDVPDTDNKNY